MACYTQEEIADREGISQDMVSIVIREMAELPKLVKSEQTAASGRSRGGAMTPTQAIKHECKRCLGLDGVRKIPGCIVTLPFRAKQATGHAGIDDLEEKQEPGRERSLKFFAELADFLYNDTSCKKKEINETGCIYNNNDSFSCMDFLFGRMLF
jgi:hypothetical protein